MLLFSMLLLACANALVVHNTTTIVFKHVVASFGLYYGTHGATNNAFVTRRDYESGRESDPLRCVF